MPTGYGYVMPDQNGWSRYLHFQAAWVVVFTGLLYVISIFLNGHLRKDLLPDRADRSWRGLWAATASHLRFKRPNAAEAWSYNVLQRFSYLFVIFGLFPFVIWTGLAMSPAFVSAVPAAVNLLGGQQSARTLHFFVTVALVLFLIVHVGMVWLAGFRSRMRAMITGRIITGKMPTETMMTGHAAAPRADRTMEEHERVTPQTDHHRTRGNSRRIGLGSSRTSCAEVWPSSSRSRRIYGPGETLNYASQRFAHEALTSS